MKKIGIIGSGTWGIALAIHLANLGNDIKIWSFSEEEVKLINNEKKAKFLPNAVIPKNVTAYLDFKEVIENSEMILHVTPSKFTRETVKKYKQYVTNQPVIICSKGFELSTLYTLGEVIKEEIPNVRLGVLSGPSHAEEVSIGIPTAIVIAAEEKAILDETQKIFSNKKLRIYKTTDIKGVELGGALKNIIAFCAGIAAGMELGDNTFAALITRGLAEISRLGVKMGGNEATFYGLTGLGDLVVTCLSEHSRNRRAGYLLGKGKTVEELKKEIGMTIESIDNIEIAYKLSKKYDVEMPIVDTAYDIVFNNLEPKKAIDLLMTRQLKDE